jgi:predicted dienelactone hydrolase
MNPLGRRVRIPPPFSRNRRRLLLAGAAAVLPTPFARAAEPADGWSAPGPWEVRVVLDEWQDAPTGRVLPVKIYVPEPAAGRDLPVTLFSHGLGGSREGGAAWGQHWASHGFISLHLQHPGSDENLWRSRVAIGDRAGLREALRSGISLTSALSRIADVRLAMEEIARRAAAGEPIAARIDRTRIGMSGHSFGAGTTLAVSGERFPGVGTSIRDPRVRASIAFSPSAAPPSAGWPARFGGIVLPVLCVTGTRDGDVLERGTTPDNRTQPFRYMPPPDKFLLVLEGADHMVFNGGRAVLADDTNNSAIAREVRLATLAFWKAYLQDDAGAKRFLQDGGMRAALGDAGTWDGK